MTIPIIGKAKLAGLISIVTLQCCCDKQTILVGQAQLPMQCPHCKRAWHCIGKTNLEVQEFFLDVESTKGKMM